MARRDCAAWVLISMLGAVACGGGAEPEPEAAPEPAATSGSEATVGPPRQGMQVEGILGTIPQRKIEDTMQGKLPALQRCFFEGMGQVEFLSGHIKFYFRVGLDGRVEYVHPRGSSIGHRATELCLLEVARKTRFPQPKGGGPAEFVWGFELEGAGGVRAPVEWDEAKLAKPIEEQRSSVDACGVDGAHYVVTLYVAPGGSVLAAGAAADSQPAADKIDCVLDAVKAWKLPDPGSYAAKVSFKL
jgi:hypothetical protein